MRNELMCMQMFNDELNDERSVAIGLNNSTEAGNIKIAFLVN
jgi:hypothetical protein